LLSRLVPVRIKEVLFELATGVVDEILLAGLRVALVVFGETKTVTSDKTANVAIDKVISFFILF